MANLASLKTAAALFIGILFVLFAYRSTPERKNAAIDGYVYEKCVDYRLIGPVRGAVVSTSIDATTVTTDSSGHFHLLTTNPVFSDEFYGVTVRSGDVVVDDNFLLNPITSPVPITFVLSPPEPVAANPKSGERCSALRPGRAGSGMLTRKQ